jgi:hypothetical protein
MQHIHHIIPKHMTEGVYDNSPDNLTPPISVALHAALHEDLYNVLGKTQDFIACKMLLGQSLKGCIFTPEVLIKLSNASKNRSEETKKKISIGLSKALKGHKHSEETKKKISQSHQGKVSGNKGHKHTDASKKKMSNSLKGKIPWNKGKINIYSDETLLKMSESRKALIKGKQIGTANN